MSTHSMRVWLTVAEGGGHWTIPEMARAMPTMSAVGIKSSVEQMIANGSLIEYANAEYGVTYDCTIPRGLTVAEVLRAAGDK